MTNEAYQYRATTPPRCGARRAIRWDEWLKWKLLGKLLGFDPDRELRCNHYAGHWDCGYDHEDINGVTWLVKPHERKAIDWSKGVTR